MQLIVRITLKVMWSWKGVCQTVWRHAKPTIGCMPPPPQTSRFAICTTHGRQLRPPAAHGAPPVVDGGVTPTAIGANDPGAGKAEHIGAAPVGSPKGQADESAVGGNDSDKGKRKQVCAAPAGRPQIPSDVPAVGGKDYDTGTTAKPIGAAPAGSLDAPAVGGKEYVAGKT